MLVSDVALSETDREFARGRRAPGGALACATLPVSAPHDVGHQRCKGHCLKRLFHITFKGHADLPSIVRRQH
jgi:hypothetical protein